MPSLKVHFIFISSILNFVCTIIYLSFVFFSQLIAKKLNGFWNLYQQQNSSFINMEFDEVSDNNLTDWGNVLE